MEPPTTTTSRTVPAGPGRMLTAGPGRMLPPRRSMLDTQRGYRADPRPALGLALQRRRDRLVEEDHDGVVVQLIDLRRRVRAQPVTLAPLPVGDDLHSLHVPVVDTCAAERGRHAGTTSRTGSFSMARVMLLGTRSSSPRIRRWARVARDSMTACASSRASPCPAQPCGP